jgi:hypothetical protein
MGYTKPELRARIVSAVKAGTAGGNAGQWSARKAQIVAQRYKKAGGGYSGPKTSKQQSLSKWTSEKWTTKSGKPSTQGPKATGERYLPKKAREALSNAEYKRTSDKKKEDTKKGKQFSKQPESVAKKTARFRK